MIVTESFWRRMWSVLRHPISVERVAIGAELQLLIEIKDLRRQVNELQSEKMIQEKEIKWLTVLVERNLSRARAEIVVEELRTQVARMHAAQMKIPNV